MKKYFIHEKAKRDNNIIVELPNDEAVINYIQDKFDYSCVFYSIDYLFAVYRAICEHKGWEYAEFHYPEDISNNEGGAEEVLILMDKYPTIKPIKKGMTKS